ncbi:unnamed protein product [Camellia sinensis]
MREGEEPRGTELGDEPINGVEKWGCVRRGATIEFFFFVCVSLFFLIFIELGLIFPPLKSDRGKPGRRKDENQEEEE